MAQSVTPHLWFDSQAEEAMNFYSSVFPDAKVVSIQRYPENAEDPHLQGMEGKVLHGVFEISGHQFMTIDGGPLFKFNPSISFFLNFDPSTDANASQNLENIWNQLIKDGVALMDLGEYPFSKKYGWVQDKYGVSWQLILTNPEGEKRPFVVPSLMFTGANTGKAEEAMNFYLSIFNNSKQGTVAKYPEDMGSVKKGSIMYGDFSLNNNWLAIMDSGVEHDFTFNEAISLFVDCQNQEEVDHFWEKLSAVPEAEQCGWLKDKYGVSWQIVPKQLGELLSDPDHEKAGRVMEALMKMKKIEVARLQKAFDGQ